MTTFKRGNRWVTKPFPYDDQHVAVIARCDEVHLGFEDHGIYTVALGFDLASGTHHGTGHMTLTHKPRDSEDHVAAPWAMDYIIRVMECLGEWSRIKGTECLVLYPANGGVTLNSKIAGIAPLPTRHGRPFIFDEVLNREAP